MTIAWRKIFIPTLGETVDAVKDLFKGEKHYTVEDVKNRIQYFHDNDDWFAAENLQMFFDRFPALDFTAELNYNTGMWESTSGSRRVELQERFEYLMSTRQAEKDRRAIWEKTGVVTGEGVAALTIPLAYVFIGASKAALAAEQAIEREKEASKELDAAKAQAKAAEDIILTQPLKPEEIGLMGSLGISPGISKMFPVVLISQSYYTSYSKCKGCKTYERYNRCKRSSNQAKSDNLDR